MTCNIAETIRGIIVPMLSASDFASDVIIFTTPFISVVRPSPLTSQSRMLLISVNTEFIKVGARSTIVFTKSPAIGTAACNRVGKLDVNDLAKASSIAPPIEKI